jgi:hypothetical protein
MSEYKRHDELVKDNPGGLDTLENPHNFSSNPGFISTAGMLGASTPAGGGVTRGTSARGSLPARPILGKPFSGGPAHPLGLYNRG